MVRISAETQPTRVLSHCQRLSHGFHRSVTTLFTTHNPTFLFPKMWEKAIKLSKELAETYESKVFDYEGLGNLLVSPGQNVSSANRRTKICVCENVFVRLRKSR